MRIALARALSIAGHPIVLLFVAALIAASARGASARQLAFIGGATLLLGAVALAYSVLQVRRGRWSHIDASVVAERRSLNLFLGALCLISAGATWFLAHHAPMSLALLLSGALIIIAMLVSRWMKVSLHASFAAFATTLLWPLIPAMIAGALVTVGVAWSRLALRRHVLVDVLAGLVLGAIAGAAFHFGISQLFTEP